MAMAHYNSIAADYSTALALNQKQNFCYVNGSMRLAIYSLCFQAASKKTKPKQTKAKIEKEIRREVQLKSLTTSEATLLRLPLKAGNRIQATGFCHTLTVQDVKTNHAHYFARRNQRNNRNTGNIHAK